jgi:hypothetical protein
MTSSGAITAKTAKALGALALILSLPFLGIMKLLVLPFEKPVDLSPEEVVSYLRDFRDGTGDGRDWDDFTSVSIADPLLEGIRKRAADLDLPISGRNAAPLDTLIAEAEALIVQTAEQP